MIRLEEHKNLHERIWNCGCLPIAPGSNYCEGCQKDVIDFMNNYGAGELTQDIRIEDLELKVDKLKKENEGLKIQLDEKIKRVEELKLTENTTNAKVGK